MQRGSVDESLVEKEATEGERKEGESLRRDASPTLETLASKGTNHQQGIEIKIGESQTTGENFAAPTSPISDGPSESFFHDQSQLLDM